MDSSTNGFEELTSAICKIHDSYSIEILEHLYCNLL
jgi:hypothetical protein